MNALVANFFVHCIGRHLGGDVGGISVSSGEEKDFADFGKVVNLMQYGMATLFLVLCADLPEGGSYMQLLSDSGTLVLSLQVMGVL